MIASLSGRILDKTTTSAVIDCQGVGYGVSLSLASLQKLGPVGAEARLLVHTHLTQDALRLYGFADPEEKACFEVLIGTTGVGPKLALAILSTLSPSELSLAVAGGDETTLTRIPGVGRKTAERLLVELKHRLPETPPPSVPTTTGGRAMSDLVSALTNLGFKLPVAEDVARGTLAAYPAEGDLTTLVRHALRATHR